MRRLCYVSLPLQCICMTVGSWTPATPAASTPRTLDKALGSWPEAFGCKVKSSCVGEGRQCYPIIWSAHLVISIFYCSTTLQVRMILHSVCSIVHSRLSCGKRMNTIALPCSGLRVVVPWRETDTAARSFLSRPRKEQLQAIVVNSAYVLHEPSACLPSECADSISRVLGL